MLPHVILHNAVSVDGRIDDFTADVELYYELAVRWKTEAVLSSSNTMLKASPPPAESEINKPLEPLPKKEGGTQSPLMFITDSRARLRGYWEQLRDTPYWRDIVVLCSRATPAAYKDYLTGGGITCITAGEDRVDFRKALEIMYTEYGVRSLRLDCGGTLNGIMLKAGLVNEVSIMVHPYLVGGFTPQFVFRAEDIRSAEDVISLKLTKVEQLKNGIVWLCYNAVYR